MTWAGPRTFLTDLEPLCIWRTGLSRSVLLSPPSVMDLFLPPPGVLSLGSTIGDAIPPPEFLTNSWRIGTTCGL